MRWLRAWKLALLLSAALAFDAQANDVWTSLWRNADQRGDALLQRGDAAAAAATFSDPRRKAYAELQAGNYEAAAQGFSGFDDADAHYNRGNALAHSGELQAALEAYDAALQRDPGNADAKRNRELVNQALQQQQQQNKQDGQPQDQQDQQKQQDPQQGESGDSQDQPGGQGDPQQGQQDPQQPQDGSTSAEDSSDPQAGPASEPQSAQDQSGDQPDASEEAAQAQRDAQAAVEQAQADEPSDKEPPADAQQAQAAVPQEPAGDGEPESEGPLLMGETGTPESEAQLAQDQWLRRIPDDPGGLLRRKFLIEHMLKQQEQQQP